MENEEKLEEQTEQVTEGTQTEPEALTEESPDTLSMIANMLEDVQTETVTEPKAEEPEIKEEPKVDEPKETPKPEIPVIPITDEIIKQYPALRGLRGKNLVTELPKHYAEAAKRLSEQGMELSKLKKEAEKPKQVEVKEEELPDPIEDPKGYAKAIQAQIEQKYEAKANAKIAELEDKLKALEEHPKQQEDKGAEVREIIKSQIGDEIEPQKAIDDFVNDNADKFFDTMGNPKTGTWEYYNANLDILIRDVVKYYNDKKKDSEVSDLRRQIEELKKNQTKKIKEEAFNQTKKNFKEAQNREPEHSEVQVASRQQPELNDNDKLLMEIARLTQAE